MKSPKNPFGRNDEGFVRNEEGFARNNGREIMPVVAAPEPSFVSVAASWTTARTYHAPYTATAAYCPPGSTTFKPRIPDSAK